MTPAWHGRIVAAILLIAGVALRQGDAQAEPRLQFFSVANPLQQGSSSSAPEVLQISAPSTASAPGVEKANTATAISASAGSGAGQGAAAVHAAGSALGGNAAQLEVIGRRVFGTSASGYSLLPIPRPGNELGIAPGTFLPIRLKQAIDSAHTQNGQNLEAELAKPVGGLPAGTPVQVTVVAASSAGKIESFGEISLQVVSIGGHPILSDVVTAKGREGRKDLADAAPARGTEAAFQPGELIEFPAS